MNTPAKLTPAQVRLLARPDLQVAAANFERAAYLSRAWSFLVASALGQYGTHGAQISGIGREHFPEHVKEVLRTIAHGITEENRIGMNSRPRGVRLSTMRYLGQVICKRDGCGFYGFPAAA